MAFASVFSVFALVLWLFCLLAPIALLVALQVWLCRKSLKLGLILPGLSLALSLLLVCGMALFAQGGGTAGVSCTIAADGAVLEHAVTEDGVTTVYDGEGNVIDRYEDPDHQPATITGAVLGSAAVLFLVANIPTVIFGGIWLHCKNRRDFQNDLKKMRVEDLG